MTPPLQQNEQHRCRGWRLARRPEHSEEWRLCRPRPPLEAPRRPAESSPLGVPRDRADRPVTEPDNSEQACEWPGTTPPAARASAATRHQPPSSLAGAARRLPGTVPQTPRSFRCVSPSLHADTSPTRASRSPETPDACWAHCSTLRNQHKTFLESARTNNHDLR